ncbi:MAG TPA: helix-turn-helix domain-containing protein [Longimicrobiales bacterium]|nr:helix-turn-helix domain-containing protein [Longimicrobiales bacterium]
MAGRKLSYRVELSPADRQELQHRIRMTTLPHREHQRARVILLLADQTTATETAQRCDLTVLTVRKWGRRFASEGMAGLKDRPRPGRPPRFSP